MIVIPPVKFRLRTPAVIVRLSIESTELPVELWLKVAALISKLAYVRPENDGKEFC